MMKMIKKIGLYLLCALCLMCFACCAQPDGAGVSIPQNTASDSAIGGSGLQDSGSSGSNDSTQDSGASGSNDSTQGSGSGSSDSSDGELEDDNELPRVPYGVE